MARPHLQPLRILPSTSLPTRAEDRASVEVYRPFFVAGILTVLTAGCLLGAIALFGIAQAGSYTLPAWTPHILAHANSQLYGWVGFFIMGFALQQHAPSVARAAVFHRLAYACLGLMGAGIAMRFVAEPLAAAGASFGIGLGLVSGVAQILAVLLFLWNIGANRHRSEQKLEWPSLFVFASLFWFFAVAVAEPFAFLGSHQPDRRQAIMFVAEWFPPLREAQFLGFVAMMVFGVAFVKFSSCFEARAADRLAGLAAFGLWTAGLLLRMGAWVFSFRDGLSGPWQTAYHTGGLLLALGALSAASASGVFAPFSAPLRSHKFLRAAFGWLIVAGMLMILEPIHLMQLGQPFSHAYTGAIRHAVTVGFLSQMIVGVGSHVAARMNSLPEEVLPRLWPTFLLLNVGNAARVVLEILTDYTPAAFAPMGITGFVELVGLGLWAGSMATKMLPRLLRSRYFSSAAVIPDAR